MRSQHGKNAVDLRQRGTDYILMHKQMQELLSIQNFLLSRLLYFVIRGR